MITLSEDGYSIKGIAPPDLRDRPEFALAFWQWVTDLGLRAKDNELSRGLDKNGKPLRRISEATRLHRRSAMTPTGRGDPSAPPLMPGRQLSRTRSLLTGRAYPDHAAFWWKFDPWTGDSWARVLDVQRDLYGRDVYGISPKAEAAVKTKAWGYWADLKAGRPIPVITARQTVPIAIPQVGRMPTAAAVFGIGAGGRAPGPGFSGGLTRKEWEAYFRQPAKVQIPSRPGGNFNVILRHIWGSSAGPAKAVAIIPKPPKPKPVVQRVAMGPKPALKGEAFVQHSHNLLNTMGVESQSITLAELNQRLPHRYLDKTMPAYFEPDERRIYLITDHAFWADPQKAMTTYRKQNAFATYNIDHITIHEAVHAKHWDALTAAMGREKARDEIFRQARETIADQPTRDRIRRHLGRLAAVAPAEFVAEVGAAVAQGRTYAEWVMVLYRQYAGPIVGPVPFIP